MSTAAMLERLVIVVVVGCSSGTPPARVEVAPLPVQQVAAFHAVATRPVRTPVAAWTLTSSDGTGLVLSKVDARAVIEGPLAFTELHLYFRNTENRVREGTFAITLPSRAAISRFAMFEGDTIKEAEVVPKALARRAYDDALQQRIDPALLEKAPGNQFTARVFPIPPNSEKHLVLSYSQELANEGYTLPLRGLPKVDEVDVVLTAVGADGLPQQQLLAERAWQPDRDFVADITSTAAVGDGTLVAGVFDVAPTFTEAAMQGAAPDKPTALTVLVDTSASRALGFARYLEEVRALIGELAGGGALHIDVIAFDQTTHAIYSGTAKELGDAPIARLAARGPGGASDLGLAASVAKGRVLIITDAVVTAGIEGPALAKAFAHAERIDVVLAGGIREERTAQTLARAGKRAGDVFDLDRDEHAAIVAALAEVVRSDVPVEVANASWYYPHTIPTARDGKQVMVYARLKAPAKALDVQIGRARYTAPVTPATPALLQRAAARAEIEELETQLAALAPADKAVAPLRIAIAKKSVAARVVSSETTMLVLDTEEDYVTYNIDRRARADILVVGPKGLAQSKRTVFARKRPPAGARVEAIEQARNAGALGSAAFASLTGTADFSTGLDDASVYGGLLGNQMGRASGQGWSVGAARGSIRRHVAAMPTVSIAMPVAAGSLDKTTIKRHIKRRIQQISYCYERELLARPQLEGTVMTRFRLLRGRVLHVEASGVDPTVARCVADVIATIEFPSTDEGAIEVNYPFHFKVNGRDLRPESLPPASEPEPSFAVAPVLAPPAPPPPLAPVVVVNAPKPEPLGAAPIRALDGKLVTVLRAIAKHDAPGALAIAKQWRDAQPGDVLAWVGLGEALEATGDSIGAARAYGSIIDLFGSRAEYRRFAGERLERTGARALAIDTYRRAVADRPEQLTGHRLLAYALVRGGDLAGAFDAIIAGVDTTPADNRYAGAPLVFARDAGMIAAAYLAAHPDQRAHVAKAMRKRALSLVTQPSTRVMLYWETDANDVDLHVRDRHGNLASFSNKQLASGGELFADVTTGFGPECFEITGKPTAGPYELAVHYYAQGPMGYGMGLLQIQRFDGKAFTFEDRPYVIMKDDAKIALGRLR
jgi:hypothetical protein